MIIVSSILTSLILESFIPLLHACFKTLMPGTTDGYRNLAGMVFVDLKKAFDTVDNSYSL